MKGTKRTLLVGITIGSPVPDKSAGRLKPKLPSSPGIHTVAFRSMADNFTNLKKNNLTGKNWLQQ